MMGHTLGTANLNLAAVLCKCTRPRLRYTPLLSTQKAFHDRAQCVLSRMRKSMFTKGGMFYGMNKDKPLARNTSLATVPVLPV